MRPWKCEGGEEGGEEGGRVQRPTNPINAADVLWVGLKASAVRVQYLCNARTWKREGHVQNPSKYRA